MWCRGRRRPEHASQTGRDRTIALHRHSRHTALCVSGRVVRLGFFDISMGQVAAMWCRLPRACRKEGTGPHRQTVARACKLSHGENQFCCTILIIVSENRHASVRRRIDWPVGWSGLVPRREARYFIFHPSGDLRIKNIPLSMHSLLLLSAPFSVRDCPTPSVAQSTRKYTANTVHQFDVVGTLKMLGVVSWES